MIQIENLRACLQLIRWMQLLGALSLLLCMISMLGVLLQMNTFSLWGFFAAVILMAGSLVALVREVLISGGALNILLAKVEENANQ